MSKIALKHLIENKGQIEGLPANPRQIDKDKFEKLKRSLVDDPEMLSLRELLVYPYNDKYIVIGGNMRYQAAKKLGMDSIPCKVIPPEMPIEKVKAILIKDNLGYGVWDWDMIANEWDADTLQDWGMEIPGWEEPQEEEQHKEEKESEGEEEDDEEDFFRDMLTDCLYDSNNDFDIPNLRIDRQAGKLILPFSPWGAESRQKKDISTYHFYVDDYRFEAIWKDPAKVLISGCTAVVEPNLSLFDTTPLAYGLMNIYKKRYIARYFQECGVKVYADLNVARKFYDYNRLGIPEGYDAFFTRGYADRIEYLKMEHQIAKEISGKDIPNFIVYGGGKAVNDYCKSNSLVYVESLMQTKKLK